MAETRRIGIFGGTFNPPHLGHIALAKAFLAQSGVDEVWMMVSPQNPFKANQQLLSDQQRLDMLRLAVADEPRLVASDYEFHLPKPSYTYNTLTRLIAEHPNTSFSLLIGGDNWAAFSHWYRGEDILRLCPVYVYPRKGESIGSPLPPNVHLLNAPLFDISSTEIRQRAQSGEDITALVSPTVADYIARHQLYK